MIYGPPSFEFTPSNISVLKYVTLPTSKPLPLLPYLRSSTCRTAKKLRFVLGTKIWSRFVGMVDENIGELPQIEAGFCYWPLACEMRPA